MMRSMFAGVSGLKTHQTRMDVIGNNIANVNTAGYKAARATFQEMLTQTLRGASAPTSDRGGTNPQQVGLGVQMGSIDVKHTQGNIQPTGYITDLAIEGEGFFILEDGENRLYTRAGMFGLDRGRDATEDGSSDGGEEAVEGSLISLVSGHRVLGYKANSDGVIDPNAKLEPLYISASEGISPKATDTVQFAGNLDARYEPGRIVSRTVQVYDSLGREHTVIVDLQRDQDSAWQWSTRLSVTSDRIPSDKRGLIQSNATYKIRNNGNGGFELIDDSDPQDIKVLAKSSDGLVWTIEDPDNRYTFELSKQITTDDLGRSDNNVIVVRTASSGNGLVLTADVALVVDEENPEDFGVITFNPDGSFLGVEPEESTIAFSPARAGNLTIKMDFAQFTQYANDFTGRFLSQNGYASGALESYVIDQNGVIVGSFSNGLTRPLGQIALAKFSNTGGLMRAGSTMYVETANSGTAQVQAPGTAGYGTIAPSSLEMSNVDLSDEFTEMIVTQRGFQANSRIITTSDEMLQELVNLKR